MAEQNESGRTRRIGVIGGGAAGLAAAWRLQSAATQVTIYEKSATPGGLLTTVAVGDVRVDPAVQLLSSTYMRLMALAREAGAGDLLVRATGRDALWRKGRAQEITYGNVASMATSAALPTMLKLKLAAKYVPFLTMQLGSLDANDPASTGGVAFDRESIATWGRREVGDDFVEYLAYPLLAAYYGSPPEDTTAAMYHALARVGMEVQLYAVRGGMAALTESIATALTARGTSIRTGADASVSGVARADGDAWTVATAAGSERYDAVVIATPPESAYALLDESADPLRTWLSGARSRAAANLCIAIEGGMRAEHFGLSFPRRDAPGDRIVAIAVQQNKPSSLVPRGRSALVVYPAIDVVERIATLDAQEALSFLAPSLERVYPGVLQRVRATSLFAGDARYRVLSPGFIRRILELRALTLPKGLAIAGDYTMAPTVEGAVRSGERAAAALLEQTL